MKVQKFIKFRLDAADLDQLTVGRTFEMSLTINQDPFPSGSRREATLLFGFYPDHLPVVHLPKSDRSFINDVRYKLN